MTDLSDDQLKRLRDLVDAPDLSGTRYSVEERLAMGDDFIKEITERGRVMYEAKNT